MRRFMFDHIRLLRYAGLFTYLCAGIPLLRVDWARQRVSLLVHPDLGLWALLSSYFLFGIVYWFLTRRLGSHRHPLLKVFGLSILTVTAIAVGWFSQSGLSALLLVVVAVALPWTLPAPIGIAWLVLQNVALVPVFAGFPGFSWWSAILQTSLYLGFATLMFVTSLVASQQDEARLEQRRLNSELRATQALLAESSRIGERIRIARELHDLLGHHLTALTLNLEVANHHLPGSAAEPVQRARAIARQLLGDVREVVSELRQSDAIDLTAALRALVEGVPPGLRVFLQVPERFSVDHPGQAQMILRMVQEILTNTLRHAGASQLWLHFRRGSQGDLYLRAWDDGHGAKDLQPGNGLRGMRERLAEYGGHIDISSPPGQGLQLDAHLPVEEKP